MKRRDFIALSTLAGASCYLHAEMIHTPQYAAFVRIRPLIAAVQEHMFPPRSKLPAAKEMHTIHFTEETLFHPTYDRDIRTFVIEGAQELLQREPHFLSYDTEAKESALRAYEKTQNGRYWLSRIIVLTMEAIFNDPIYSSNIKEAGWRSVQSFGGEPRPQTRYIEL
jgi:hypothetical protein